MKIVLGIGGSIAAYKALELTRELVRGGHEVRIVLTSAGSHFVTPLSCQTLSRQEVYCEQFILTRGIVHLSLNDWGDIFVIAPATADIIGKAAAGIADDLLTTTLVSWTKPVLFIPAMDEGMWSNPRVQRNVEMLLKDNCHFLNPAVGALASGKIGRGRFPAVELMARKIESVAAGATSLKGLRGVITGGRTEADIDSVRVITNRASGNMVRELVIAAHCRDAEVQAIIGETSIGFPDGLTINRVRTAGEMQREINRYLPSCDFVIMAAAVNDYEPVKITPRKIHQPNLTLRLRKTPDIIRQAAGHKRSCLCIGFSLEDKLDPIRAREKLRNKNLDLVVYNTTRALGGQATDARIMDDQGRVIASGITRKWDLANRILDLCCERLIKTDAARHRRRKS